MNDNSCASCKSIDSNRKEYLDALKCLAIVLVVVCHIDGMKIGVGEYETLWGSIRHTFQMPLFFFISGMFARNGIDKRIPLQILLWKKVKMLLWPAIIFEIIMSLVIGNNINLPSTGTGYYWFTFTLFECFLIYYIFAYIFRTKKNILNILLAAISVGFVGMLALKINHPSVAFLDLSHLTKYFQYFFMGTLYNMYSEWGNKLLKSQNVYTSSILGFSILMFLVYKGILPNIINAVSRDILLRYMGLFIVFSIFYNMKDYFNLENWLMKTIRYVGKHSLEIYLLHFFFLPTLVWLKPFRDDNMFVIELPISLLIAFAVIGIVLMLNFVLTRSKHISLLLYGK